MLDALIDAAETSPIALTAVHADRLQDWLQSQDASVGAWAQSTGFTAKPGSFCLLPAADASLRQVLVGVEEDIGIWSCADLPAALPAGQYQLDESWPDARQPDVQLGWLLGSYRFSRYRDDEEPPQARLVARPGADTDSLRALAAGIGLTRDLINTPAGDMMPAQLATAMRELAEAHGAEFDEIVDAALLEHNYPLMHAVGRASVHAPRLLDLRWGQADAPRLMLVGKGVCFDSGGLDLKPANGMRLMKKDMGGAAHVLGLASMIMSAGLPVRLRVLVPAVENAVAGNAFRPGDVIRARSGKSVEIDNTDAEGRLVLCDALTEAITEDPDLLIDMATLTGAARVAMGPDVPAIFANQAATAAQLQATAIERADPLWPLPLHAPYKRWLQSDVADLVNSASVPLGGAITAALFLQEFVGSQRDWVHMDVMAWNTENLPGRPRGGEAMGLRTFFAYLQQRYGG